MSYSDVIPPLESSQEYTSSKTCYCLSENFSIVLDECLKRLVQDVLTIYIISVDQLVNTLMTLFPGQLPLGAMLFSIDAIGMYVTSIPKMEYGSPNASCSCMEIESRTLTYLLTLCVNASS